MFSFIKKFKKNKIKVILFFIYLFLFSPIFITIILNNTTHFHNKTLFLKIFVSIITILSFISMVAVYYYNFFIKKEINTKKFNSSTHLLKIFICYFYVVFIFANLFYMAQYLQNITLGNTKLLDQFFNFSKNNNSFYTTNSSLFANCLYLSITTITTIGYGDVVPNHIYGKFLVAIEAILGQILWGLSMTLWFNKKIKNHKSKL